MNIKKGDTVVVKWASSYVSLTALESKRDLNDYITTSALNSALGNFYDKGTADGKYVPYSGATDDVKLGDNSLIVGEDPLINNPAYTKISKRGIELRGRTQVGAAITEKGVDITADGIFLENGRFNYPDDTGSGTLATQKYVTTRGYQTSDEVGALINAGTVKLKGDVTGNGKVNDTGIITTLSNTGIHAGTYSALTVDTKGRATRGWQQIVFAPNLDDPTLSNLAINGVAIIDA